MRKLDYCGAIREAMSQEMERDERVFVYGIGVPTFSKIFGTTKGLQEKFGPDRCFDTPISEDAMTGFGLGAAIRGLRPIHVHIRVDFMLLATNQLVNMVSNYIYSTGGKLSVPLVVRAVIGRGWGQGAQHSKSLFSNFTHIPGLKVIAPTTPADAKGMLTAAIRDDNPVICFEHRWLYWAEEDVPEPQRPFIAINIALAKSWPSITRMVPHLPDAAASPVQVESHADRLEIIFSRDERATDLTYDVQVRDNLGAGSWTTIARSVAGQPVAPVASFTPTITETSASAITSVRVIRKVRVADVQTMAGHGSRFLRVLVTQTTVP